MNTQGILPSFFDYFFQKEHLLHNPAISAKVAIIYSESFFCIWFKANKENVCEYFLICYREQCNSLKILIRRNADEKAACNKIRYVGT